MTTENEPGHNKYKIRCAPSHDTDQPVPLRKIITHLQSMHETRGRPTATHRKPKEEGSDCVDVCRPWTSTSYCNFVCHTEIPSGGLLLYLTDVKPFAVI